jgi:hypothetical protein
LKKYVEFKKWKFSTLNFFYLFQFFFVRLIAREWKWDWKWILMLNIFPEKKVLTAAAAAAAAFHIHSPLRTLELLSPLAFKRERKFRRS